MTQASTARTLLIEKFNNQLDTVRENFQNFATSADASNEKVRSSINVICENMANILQHLAERDQLALENMDSDTGLASEIPEYRAAKPVIDTHNVAPFLRSMPLKSTEFGNARLDADKIASLMVIARDCNAAAESYLAHIRAEQNILSNVFRTALNLYGVSQAGRNIFLPAPKKDPFCVEGYALCCLKACILVARMPTKDFLTQKDLYLKSLKNTGITSLAYQNFWNELSSPGKASHYLHKYFSVLTPVTIQSILNVLHSELELITAFRAQLNDESLPFAISGENSKALETFSSPFPGLATLVQTMRYEAYSTTGEPGSISTDDVFGLRELLTGKGAEDELVLSEQEDYVNEMMERGFGLPEAEFLAAREFDTARGGHERVFEPYTFVGRATGGKRVAITDGALVPPKRKKGNVSTSGGAMVTKNTQSFRESLQSDIRWLDRLVGPFGKVMKNMGLNLNFDFGFLTWGYQFSELASGEIKSIYDYFNAMPDFYTMWVHIGRCFDPTELRVFSKFLSEHFEDYAKAAYVTGTCLARGTSTSSFSREESTLLEIFKRNTSLFPMTMSFREMAFIQSYLAARAKEDHLITSSAALLCVYDEFLFEPHIQMLMMFSIGLFIEFLERNSSRDANDANMFNEVLKLIKSQDTDVYNSHSLMTTILVLNRILDDIYRLVANRHMQKSTDIDSSATRDELKSFGHVHLENEKSFREIQPGLVACVKNFENGLNKTTLASSSLFLKSFNQLKNVALLVSGTKNPLAFMQIAGYPILEMNKAIANFLYYNNKDVTSPPESASDNVDDLNTVETACGETDESDEQLLESLPAQSLAQLLMGLVRRRNKPAKLYRITRTGHPYRLDLGDSQRFVLPLSYMPLLTENHHRPGFFGSAQKYSVVKPIWGDSNVNDRASERYLLASDDDFAKLKESFGLEPVEKECEAKLGDHCSLYYASSRLPSATAKKCVRHGNDLCVVNTGLSYSWLLSVLDGLNPSGKSQCVCVTRKRSAEIQCPNHTIHEPFEPINRDGNLFLINVIERGQGSAAECVDDTAFFRTLYDFNANGDAIAVPDESLFGRAGSYDNIFPYDVLSVVDNYRRESLEKQAAQSAEHARRLAETCANNQATTAPIVQAPLSEILTTLSAEVNNENVLQLPLFNYPREKMRINQLFDPLANSIDQLVPLVKPTSELASSSAGNIDENNVIKKGFNELYGLLAQTRRLLPEMMEQHYKHGVYMTNLLNTLEVAIQTSMLPIWALVHFHAHPYMYVLNSPQINAYNYLRAFLDFPDGGGLYINLPAFVEYAETHPAYNNLMVHEYMLRIMALIRNFIMPDKPYVYLFQSCNALKTPVIPFYLGIVCVFLAHVLNGKV